MQWNTLTRTWSLVWHGRPTCRACVKLKSHSRPCTSAPLKRELAARELDASSPHASRVCPLAYPGTCRLDTAPRKEADLSSQPLLKQTVKVRRAFVGRGAAFPSGFQETQASATESLMYPERSHQAQCNTRSHLRGFVVLPRPLQLLEASEYTNPYLQFRLGSVIS